MLLRIGLSVWIGTLAGSLFARPSGGTNEPAGSDAARLYLLRYATSAFPVAFATTRGEHQGRQRLPLAWLFYVLRAGDRTLLIDTGFSEARRRAAFQIQDFVPPGDLLTALGIQTDQVSDLLLSHGHFDHAGELARFPAARLWLRGPALQVLRSRHGPGGVDAVLRRARHQGRLRTLPATGDGLTPVLDRPGLRVDLRFSGGHSAGSQLIRIQRGRDVYWITGDECYLAADCREGRPIPARAAFSPAANRATVAYLKKEAARGATLLSLHDPELAGRFTREKSGVFRVF